MDYEQIMTALRNAHAAGDVKAARRLAQMAQAARQGQSAAPAPAEAPQTLSGAIDGAWQADGSNSLMGSLLTPEGQAQRRSDAQATAQASLPEGYQLLGTFANNGRVYRAPDGSVGAVSADTSTTDPAAVQRIMAGDTFEQIVGDEMQQEFLDRHPIAARANEVVRGVPFLGSWTDDAVGAVSPQAGEAMAYSADAMSAQHPGQTLGLNVAGGILGAIPMAMAAAPSLPSGLLGRMGIGALGGATEGAIWGAGEGQGRERIGNAGRMAALGGLLGGAIPAVGGAVSGAVNGVLRNRAVRSMVANAPQLDDLAAEARALFNGAKGLELPRNEFTPAADAMIAEARQGGMAPGVTNTAQSVANNIEEAATRPQPTIDWLELDALRNQADVAAGHLGNPREARIGAQFVEGIDNFIDQLDPAVAAQVQQARAIWGRLRRSQRIDRALRNAELSASGTENGLRNEFRRILKDEKARRGFSEDEIKAMEAVVQGTRWGNILRFVGTMGAPTDQGRNFLGAAIGATAGSQVLGPVGAIALPAAATGIRGMAEASTRRAAATARALAASGGLLDAPQISNEARGLLEYLMQGAGRQPAERVSPF